MDTKIESMLCVMILPPPFSNVADPVCMPVLAAESYGLLVLCIPLALQVGVLVVLQGTGWQDLPKRPQSLAYLLELACECNTTLLPHNRCCLRLSLCSAIAFGHCLAVLMFHKPQDCPAYVKGSVLNRPGFTGNSITSSCRKVQSNCCIVRI